MRYKLPWGVWMFEDGEDAIKLSLRLRCQGYTVELGEELDSKVSWKEVYP
jgi:hypothetical protein